MDEIMSQATASLSQPRSLIEALFGNYQAARPNSAGFMIWPNKPVTMMPTRQKPRAPRRTTLSKALAT